MPAAAKTMTTAELAAELGTTPRELRKYLRSAELGVGKGSRYALPGNARELTKLRKGFDAWSTATEKAKSDKKAKLTDATDEVIEDDSDEEPTEDELDEIDDED